MVLSDEANLSRTIDLEGTRKMVCLDNLPPHEVASLMAAYGKNENASDGIAVTSSSDAALLPTDAVMAVGS